MVQPSQKAQELATLYQIDPQFVEVILKEADEILGGVYRTLLTIKDNIMIANAGADLSNNPKDHVTLWPKNPSRSANKIRKDLEKRTGKRLIVLIIDSRTTPLRLGTSGIAIGIAGINPIKDYRTKRDLFGKKLIVTTLAVADALASVAHLVMGEGNEAIPLVIIRNSEISVDLDLNPDIAKMPKERCLYMKVLQEYMKKSEGNKV
ncbi:MAG: coenzyme F420-0:L-glutamate ligase [Candidatus Hodarchaeota archaeon]